MYEVSPDYGMIVQAWNIYSFAVPIVRQFFGIEPMASRKEIRIRPLMPSSWDKASLENVWVGQNRISIYFEELESGEKTIRVLQDKADWKIVFEPGDGIVEVIKGEVTAKTDPEVHAVQLTGQEIQITYR
jgi:hypothetical protein